MPLDTSVFDKLKTFADYQKVDQDFQMRKALAAQQLQTGGIDAASKSNVYATQVLSAATATGDQNAYDQAKQHLTQNGIDVSTWAPDVKTGAEQAQAARLSQTPYGVLFNGQQKIISNDIAATQAMGSKDAAAQSGLLQPIPTISPTGGISIAPQIQPALPARGALPPIIQPKNQVQAGTPAGDQALKDLYGDSPAKPVVLSTDTPNSVPQFNFRAQLPGETLAAYKDAQQQAFEEHKFNNTQPIERAKAQGSTEGKAIADAKKNATGAEANFDQVVQTINGIKTLNNSESGLPEDRMFVPARTKAYLAQNIGDTTLGNALGVPSQAVADNANAFTKLNEAQTIGAIKELASTGQIRMTRTLENILNRGYLIEPGASKASKDQQAELILAELNNSKIAAQNVNAGLNGGQAVPYQQMPTPPTSGVSPTDAINELRRRGKL